MRSRFLITESDLLHLTRNGARVRGGVDGHAGHGPAFRKPAPPVQEKEPGKPESSLAPAPSIPQRFTIYGVPVAKPRMTQRDKWQQRPCVLRYREFCDRAREAAGWTTKKTLYVPVSLTARVFLEIPKSKRKGAGVHLGGKPCTSKPDWDNLGKSLGDALFQNDEKVWRGSVEKYWDDGKGPRIEVEIGT